MNNIDSVGTGGRKFVRPILLPRTKSYYDSVQWAFVPPTIDDAFRALDSLHGLDTPCKIRNVDVFLC